jgi:uncharacterized protein (TIGR00369 family)
MPDISIEQSDQMLKDMFAPWIQELNISFEAVGKDGVTARMPLSDRLYRTGGTVCGQALMSFADTVMVFAVTAALGEFRPMTTVNQSTNFMKPISNADVIGKARILRLGRTMAFGEVLLYADGSDGPAVQVSCAYALLS